MSKQEVAMKIRVSISRTFQADQYHPVKIEAEIEQENITDYESAYNAAYEKIESSLLESEIKLRDIYSAGIDTDRKPKNRKLKRNV